MRGVVALAFVAVVAVGVGAYETKPPNFSYGPTKLGITTDSLKLLLSLDEPGTVYSVAVASGATAPSPAQVKAGTDAAGATPVARGMKVLADTAKTTVRLATFSTESVPTGPTTYDIYVVAEDANLCPVCSDPYNDGCTEACQDTCTTGLCPSPNIQENVTVLSVVLPYPWRPDMGPGYPGDFGSAYDMPIQFASTRLDTTSTRRRLLSAGGGPERELLAFSGKVTETIGTFGTAVDPYKIMTQRHKAGHALVQWEVAVTFDKPVDGFDYTSLMTSGCFVSGFEADSDTVFTVQLTACDPLSRGVSPEANLEHISGRLMRRHGNVRTDPSGDGGGKCVLRVPDRSYVFKPPGDVCPTSVDDEGDPVAGGQTDCGQGVVIPNMASDPLHLPYTEFVQQCPSYYSSRHRTAQSPSVLSDTLDTFAATFKDIHLI